MPTIPITVSSAPLPEGWQGTPDEFRQQVFSTLVFSAESGEFLTGQIGGSLPQTNVGLYIDGQSLYTWSEEDQKYLPITTHPVGSALPYFGSIAPTNYLLCDGGLYLREEYPDLYAVLADAHKLITETIPDHFRTPNLKGRTVFGIGVGEYNALEDPNLKPGQMREIILHQYDGLEWPRQKVARHVGQPAATVANPGGDGLVYTGSPGQNNYTRSMPPNIGVNWIIRAK